MAAAPVAVYALLAAGTVAAGYAQYSAGRAQQLQYKLRARQEETAARDREIQRKQQLLQALAVRAVSQGASGTTGEGTPRELVVNDFKNYELDKLRGYASTSALTSALDAAGANAATVGRIQFGASLFTAAGNYYTGTSGLPSSPGAAPGGTINTSGSGLRTGSY